MINGKAVGASSRRRTFESSAKNLVRRSRPPNSWAEVPHDVHLHQVLLLHQILLRWICRHRTMFFCTKFFFCTIFFFAHLVQASMHVTPPILCNRYHGWHRWITLCKRLHRGRVSRLPLLSAELHRGRVLRLPLLSAELQTTAQRSRSRRNFFICDAVRDTDRR